ncbi:MAG: hypothetical protein Q4B69_08030 [Slackia sp.]|nr:hypothetical protein [Slackia sp.]
MHPAISHISAARFWVGCDDDQALAVKPFSDEATNEQSIALSADALEAVRSTLAIDAQETVHFLAGLQKLRRTLAGASCHSISNPLPQESFVEMVGLQEALIVSPELSFVQMGAALHFVDLVRYGSALCSLFAIDRSDPNRPIIRREKPIASIESISRFIESAPRMKGAKMARSAIPCILENARSPLEIDAALHMCLPRCKGGSGLPRPILNQKIWLDRPIETTDRAGVRRYIDSFECDLVWEDGSKTVVVEYQGESYHSHESAIHRDSVKINALASQGVRVFVLTKKQLYDLVQFRRFVESLRKAIGARDRSSVRDFEQRQTQLHARLVSPLQL